MVTLKFRYQRSSTRDEPFQLEKGADLFDALATSPSGRKKPAMPSGHEISWIEVQFWWPIKCLLSPIVLAALLPDVTCILRAEIQLRS
jgi:hypothetical protein